MTSTRLPTSSRDSNKRSSCASNSNKNLTLIFTHSTGRKTKKNRKQSQQQNRTSTLQMNRLTKRTSRQKKSNQDRAAAIASGAGWTMRVATPINWPSLRCTYYKQCSKNKSKDWRNSSSVELHSAMTSARSKARTYSSRKLWRDCETWCEVFWSKRPKILSWIVWDIPNTWNKYWPTCELTCTTMAIRIVFGPKRKTWPTSSSRWGLAKCKTMSEPESIFVPKRRNGLLASTKSLRTWSSPSCRHYRSSMSWRSRQEYNRVW